MPVYPPIPAYPNKAHKVAKDQWNKLVDDQMLELTKWWLRRWSPSTSRSTRS
jgi:hypothetical protein